MSLEYFQDIIGSRREYSGYALKPIDRPGQNKMFYCSNEMVPGSKSYYLKVFSNEPDEIGELPLKKLKRELIASKLVRDNLGIPTPVSVCLGMDESGQSALLQEEVCGVPFDILMNSHENLSREALRVIAYQTGIYLARIHELTASHFGDIFPEGDVFLNWAGCFSEDVKRHVVVGLERGILNQTHADYFEERLTEPVLRMNNSSPTLCHGDFTPQNIIIDPNTHVITGIIDFEVAKYWVPEWDLTRVNAILEHPSVNRDLWDSFMNGYAFQGQMQLYYIKRQIDYYKPFESLDYWIWGWGRPRFREDIKQDIVRVTQISHM